jgi:hypothetical protein
MLRQQVTAPHATPAQARATALPAAGVCLAALALGGCGGADTTEAPAATPAVLNCMAAVAGEAGVRQASTESVTQFGASTSVQVQVPGDLLPWTCIADADGTVTEVYRTGDTEGVPAAP